MNIVWEEERFEAKSFYPLLIFSVGFHLLFLLFLGWFVRFSPPQFPPAETVVQLVDPPAPPKPSSILFGTRDPKELEKIPRKDVTHLPPIPRSAFPAPEVALAQPRQQPPAISPPPAAPQTRSPVNPGSSVAPDFETEGNAPASHLPMSTESRQGQTETARSDSDGVGLPGVPFAQAQDLQRLVKVFSDENKRISDPISINSEDLRYLAYGIHVGNKLEPVWKYPEQAIRERISGEVVLDVMIRRDGSLDNLILVQSSGYSILDDEAVHAIRQAAPYPPLPQGITEEPFTMRFVLHYINDYSLGFRRIR
jgi:protein TonB